MVNKKWIFIICIVSVLVANTKHSWLYFISDVFGIFGMILLVLGLFQMVKSIGFFLLPKYSILRMLEVIRHKSIHPAENKYGKYHEYVASHDKKINCTYMMIGSTFIIISLLIGFFFV